MSSIALFPCNYTPAAEVVDSLSRSLKLRVYSDDDLIADTCRKYDYDPVSRVAPETVRQMFYKQTSVFNQFSLEKEIVVNKLKSVLVEKLAFREKHLFYGFHSLLVPQRISHILKVLVVDSAGSRVERAVAGGVSVKEARKKVRNHDVSANDWADFLYRQEAYDNKLYDLVISAQQKTAQEIIGDITKRYQATAVLPQDAPSESITDMTRAVRIERTLLLNGHKLAVEVDGDVAIIVVQKNVFSFSTLRDELTELAQQVDGVEQVKVVQDYSYDASVYRKRKFEFPSKVLFVDDEKEFVQTVSQRLISRDFGTYGVFSGEEALDLVAEDRPDVMVLDLKMVGMHGVEVLRQTKEIAPEVEVIILTGHGTSEDMKQCMRLGAFAYMNKPVNIEELSDTIKKAYEKIQQRHTS